jgi:hypothetical protein
MPQSESAVQRHAVPLTAGAGVSVVVHVTGVARLGSASWQSAPSYVPAVVVPVHADAPASLLAVVHWPLTFEQCPLEQSESFTHRHAVGARRLLRTGAGVSPEGHE